MLEWPDEVNLAIHLPGMVYNSPYAMWIKLKISGNRRRGNEKAGFKLSSEMDNLANEGGPAIVRSGQFWGIDGGLLGITSILESKIEGRRWDGAGRKQTSGIEVQCSALVVRNSQVKKMVILRPKGFFNHSPILKVKK